MLFLLKNRLTACLLCLRKNASPVWKNLPLILLGSLQGAVNSKVNLGYINPIVVGTKPRNDGEVKRKVGTY